MAHESNKIKTVPDRICKYYNEGFCKFRDKCFFKHVMEDCKTKDCKKDQCLKRHPKRCKFFFLRKFCKFKIDCKFSHNSDSNDDEDIKKVQHEITEIQRENEIIKSRNKELENDISKLEEKLANVQEDLKALEKERDRFEIENQEIKEINKILMEDLAVLNERIGHLIPGNLENEIDELKENNAILKAILQMYKQEETNYDTAFENEREAEQLINCDDDVETSSEALISFDCQECNFFSRSQRGLNVHIGLKHRQSFPHK